MREDNIVRTCAAAVLVAVVMATSACTGGDDDGEQKAADRQVSPEDLPSVPSLGGDVAGAKRDATLDDCSTDPGAQTLEATFTNSADETRDAVITVSWTNDSSDVLARAVGVVEGAKPGADSAVTLEADVPEGVSECVVNVRAGKLEK